MARHDTLVQAGTINEGECFRKKTGEYVYLRIRLPGSRMFDVPAGPGDVYGVCYNGGVTKVNANTYVVPMPHAAMAQNEEQTRLWEQSIGARPTEE